MMKFPVSIILAIILNIQVLAQDTFSIVAVDSATGEVGSAGASCVDLVISFPNFDTDFLGELLPGLGAINTQAFYLEQNQINARNQLLLGRTPSEAITWLEQNDVQGNATIRQYGIAALINGSPEAAGFTGSQTNSYTGQRVGPNYSIQGNILLGPEILDSMEARFLASDGDLRCKLMSAMQGANVVGADSRCSVYGTSSLFAFLKVALPGDAFGSPTHLISVKTSANDGIEPIDSLQSLFDQAFPNACDPVIGGIGNAIKSFKVFPNPTESYLKVQAPELKNLTFKLISLEGGTSLSGRIENTRSIDVSSIKSGTYILQLSSADSEPFRELIQIK